MGQERSLKIVIGSDHRGFHHKLLIAEQMKKFNGAQIEWLDAGCFTAERCDYPEFAAKAVAEIKKNDVEYGVLICGSGVGMSIAANRYPGIYAALAWDELTARLAKEHDGANILVLPADFISSHTAVAMIEAWLNAKFLGGRYQKRLEILEELVATSRD
jgi:ribose 5-phosphate isomerase B